MDKTPYLSHYFKDTSGKFYLAITYQHTPETKNVLARGCEIDEDGIQDWIKLTIQLHHIHPMLWAPSYIEREKAKREG